MNMNLLSLDTSTKKTGWALFQDGKYKKSGVIAFDDKDTMTRLMNMHYEIEILIEHRHIDMVVIETTSAPRNAQTQRHLTMLLGMVYAICCDKCIEFVMLRPSEWRKMANIKKEKLGRKRVELKQWSKDLVKELYNIDVKDDESDAILIGYGYIQSFDE